jgi:hypothetical protein
MKMKTIIPIALGVLVSWTAPAGQEKLAASIAETRVETARTRDQLQRTVDALKALTAQKKGDLKQTYDLFAAEVKQTQAAADYTAARAKSMESASKDYFGTWQTEVSGIANESLRKKAQKRLDSVRSSYDKVIASLRTSADKFKPFLADLGDVQKALANDVTPGGVKAIRGVASDAEFKMKGVRRTIADALEELEKMEKALSSETKG